MRCKNAPTPDREGGELQLEFEFPALSYEIFAEAVVLLFGHERETFLLVDVPSTIQNAVGPQRELAVTLSQDKADILLYQARLQFYPTGYGFGE